MADPGDTALRDSMIEDYLLINGPYLTDTEAARRMGRTPRTIQRYKAVLRERGQLGAPAQMGPVLEPGRTGPGWCMCGCGRQTRRAGRKSGGAAPVDGWARYVPGHTSRTAAARRQKDAAS